MLVVTGVGFLIHLYSTEYMDRGPGLPPLLRLPEPVHLLDAACSSWGTTCRCSSSAGKGVGLCSYLLIGFWFDDEKNATAGKKAFIANRIGDFGLLVAMAILLYYVGRARLGRHRAPARGESARARYGLLADFPAARRAGATPAVHVSAATLVGLAPVPGLRRQERADPALRLAAGRDGGSDAGQRAYPRGHHGHRGRLPGLPHGRRSSRCARSP